MWLLNDLGYLMSYRPEGRNLDGSKQYLYHEITKKYEKDRDYDS